MHTNNPSTDFFPFNIAILRAKNQTRHHFPFIRAAVRAIAPVNQQLLMVYSSEVGDYKFPGGGVKAGETHQQALNRELQEETGRNLALQCGLLGTALELDLSTEIRVSSFRMISFYYLCTLEARIQPLSLEPYEQSLGFTPVWISPAEALRCNEKLAADSRKSTPFWLEREIEVLRLLIPIIDNLDCSN